MKAKFLNRIEPEKRRYVKVVFTVPVGNKEVFALERGREYDINLCDRRRVKCDKVVDCSDKCVNCATWERSAPASLNLPNGLCGNSKSNHYGERTPIYHWCSNWQEATHE